MTLMQVHVGVTGFRGVAGPTKLVLNLIRTADAETLARAYTRARAPFRKLNQYSPTMSTLKAGSSRKRGASPSDDAGPASGEPSKKVQKGQLIYRSNTHLAQGYCR